MSGVDQDVTEDGKQDQKYNETEVDDKDYSDMALKSEEEIHRLETPEKSRCINIHFCSIRRSMRSDWDRREKTQEYIYASGS